MKKLLTIVVLLLGVMSYAQEKDQFHSVSYVTSPGSLDDGYSFGIQYEHQNNTMYYGGELYIFPDLNTYDYAHLVGRFGLNYRPGNYYRPFRLHAGPRIGFISRESANGPLVLLGLEAGIQFTFDDHYFIGLSVNSDIKTDSKPLWGVDNHTVNSGYLSIGYRF